MSPAAERPDLSATEALIAARRTSLLVDVAEPVERSLVERLVALIGHAPNHKKTRPWRVLVCVDEARAALGNAWAEDLEASGVTDAAKLAKVRSKYLRAPVVILVGCAPDPDENRHREDLLAVAAGVQNLLLGAEAAGLAAMWATPPALVSPRVNTLAGWDPATEAPAVIYLGWPSAVLVPTERPPVSTVWLTSATPE